MEKTVEQYFVSRAKRAGILSVKLVCPGYNGMPDRMLLMPDGRVAFVELKDKGKKPRPLQLRMHKRLRDLGFKVDVLDSCEAVDRYYWDLIDERVKEADSGFSGA